MKMSSWSEKNITRRLTTCIKSITIFSIRRRCVRPPHEQGGLNMKLSYKGGTLKGSMIVSKSGVKTRDGEFGYDEISSVDIISTSSQQKQGGWMGRAVVGTLVAGPVGALVGAGTRSNKTLNNVAFMMTFKGGDTFFTEADSATFNTIYGRVLSANSAPSKPAAEPAAFSLSGKFSADPSWVKWGVVIFFVFMWLLMK
ncbi:hypothetical protein HWC07_gp102 [Pantoea phage vB_PagM_LIET2]|uniref:Uncharacterized protein n=1 Tax=Pantoea phage vB_PagM_LIET2 TaxID=2508071 RepID=A0A411AW78_9CAUD|nr:hypothetical protein HWC07_gp102 [Pantoea phage vB_PagM_LIET2]QAX92354.1 hypothetical protein LIET2_gp102 [Pantoea phage vB_PagM_LIET2]